jgi:hypothetical protein
MKNLFVEKLITLANSLGVRELANVVLEDPRFSIWFC